MSGVAGLWEAAMKIDGYGINIGFPAFNEITVRSGIHRDLPTLTVSLIDKDAALLEKIGMVDGQKVELEMGDARGEREPFKGKFKIVGDPNAVSTPKGMNVSFKAVLDNIPWMRKVTDTYFEGTSSQLISKLASEAGLKPIVDATQDAMTWLPNRKPLATYARFASDHGWAGPKSCMLLGVGEDAELFYKNLENLIAQKGDKVYGHNPGNLIVHGIQLASKGAAYNSSAAWGATQVGDKLTGVFEELKDVVMTQFSGSLGFSPDIAKSLGKYGGRIIPLPIDAGNTHDNYSKAKHQNRRIKSTYGFDIHTLIHQISGIKLFDNVKFMGAEPMSGRPMKRLHGNYLITNKVMSIQNNIYVEKSTLTAQGPGGV